MRSPNRLDALVRALTELMPADVGPVAGWLEVVNKYGRPLPE